MARRAAQPGTGGGSAYLPALESRAVVPTVETGVLFTVMMALRTRCDHIQRRVRASASSPQEWGMQSSSMTAKTSTSPSPSLSALPRGLTGLNPRACPTTQNATEVRATARAGREARRDRNDDSTREAACALVVRTRGDEKLWL
jgi:hypothetical protein